MPGPLEGLKVIDIGWIMAGPWGLRHLADLGADVIKVESGKRLDPLRTLGPFKDGEPGPERSLSYHMTNAGKRGLAVDVKAPEGVDIVRRLVATSDVFAESFTPGAIDAMGLSYATLSAINPRLIMVSSGLLGRKGTMGMGMSGTGMTGSAFSGATNLVGWSDRPPQGPQGPWTDGVAPRYLAATVLAAVHRRRTTGQGCYIDISQAEAGLQFLAPAFFEWAVNGDRVTRRGSAASPLKAPCNAYPCAGADRWIVIDADTAPAWAALRSLLSPDLDDPMFDTLVGRLRARDVLDARISAWTKMQVAASAEAALQTRGVPAHVICDDLDLAEDADLTASGFHAQVHDPLLGDICFPGPRIGMSGDTLPQRPGPRIGDQSREILAAELGLSANEIDALQARGVMS